MSVLLNVPQLESRPVQGSARFQALVDKVDLQYGDLLYFCEVRLALLMDITTHLSALNVKLQGKDILVTDMHAHITTFDVGKPGIVEAQLANDQLEHFPRLAACVPDDVEPDTFVSVSPLWGRNLHPVS